MNRAVILVFEFLHGGVQFLVIVAFLKCQIGQSTLTSAAAEQDEKYSKQEQQKGNQVSLIENSLLNYNMESFTSRCDGLIIDNFPHDANYFTNQLLAVKNYYYSISNTLIDFEIGVLDSIYTVSQYMEDYSYSDENKSFIRTSLNDIFYNNLIKHWRIYFLFFFWRLVVQLPLQA